MRDRANYQKIPIARQTTHLFQAPLLEEMRKSRKFVSKSFFLLFS